MPITREHVKKTLFDGDGGNVPEQGLGGSKKNPAGSRPMRQVNKPGAGKEVVDLSKMTSMSFNNLIGEGPSSTAFKANQSVKANKKIADKLKMLMMTNLNNAVVHSDSVNVEEGHSDHESSAAGESHLKTAAVADGTVEDSVQTQGCDVARDDRVEDLENLKSVTVNVGGKNVHIDLKSKLGEIDKHKEPKSSSPHKNVIEDSILDATIPLFHDTEVQTDKCHILCTCKSCKDFVHQFSLYLNSGYSENCIGTKICSNGDDSIGLPFVNSSTAARNTEEAEEVPLFKGSKVKISVTAKAKLKILDKKDRVELKEYVDVILGDLYEGRQLANMTAAGRTKGSVPVPQTVRDDIMIYMQNKFEDVEDSEITSLINSKCYRERRKLWGKDDSSVRKPLKKNVKKADGESENSIKKKKGEEKNEETSENSRNSTVSRKRTSKHADRSNTGRLSHRRREVNDSRNREHQGKDVKDGRSPKILNRKQRHDETNDVWDRKRKHQEKDKEQSSPKSSKCKQRHEENNDVKDRKRRHNERSVREGSTPKKSRTSIGQSKKVVASTKVPFSPGNKSFSVDRVIPRKEHPKLGGKCPKNEYKRMFEEQVPSSTPKEKSKPNQHESDDGSINTITDDEESERGHTENDQESSDDSY